MKHLILLFSCFCSLYCTAQSVELLLHQNWQFRQCEGDSAKWYTANVPGTVHTDLLAHGLISDPHYATNEDSVQWVEKMDWEYTTTFVLNDSLLQADGVDLIFEGLDTYAAVFLNDSLLFSANNMFLDYKKAVKNYLRVGDNVLHVKFYSPIQTALPAYKKLGYTLPAGNDAAAEKVSIFTRKAPYHYGWDWGPRLVTMGIWRPVRLKAWWATSIEHMQVKQLSLNKELAQLTALVELSEQLTKHKEVLEWELYLADSMVQVQRFNRDTLKGVLQANFSIEQPEYWWPNGYGKAHLYEVTSKIYRRVGGQRLLVAESKQMLGLRTIQLIHEPDSIGTSYYFKINDVPIFMKGANYIPSSHFIPSVSAARYQQIVQDAVAANMNMLRVWGGGIYENDIFYELCDKNGLLVWQDFMFACSMYPPDTAFANLVAKEVRQNVRRLQKHPSIALWCGNNEMDVAWHNWGWQKQFGYTKKDSATIWAAYKTMFHEIIPQIVKQLDERAYVSTSPLSNWGKPENFNHASMHYWGVWHGEEPFENFKTNVGRFMAEYGFQSFPSFAAVQQFADSSMWALDGEVLQARQKSYKGNRLIFEHMKRHYKQPDDFRNFLYVNTLLQSKGLKTAIMAHRLAKPHCMGTLYWQLNDCWPAISWSSTDYYGNWKAAHYTVREMYAPILPVITKNGKNLHVHVVSDMLDTLQTTIWLDLYDFESGQQKSVQKEVRILPNSSQPYWSIPAKLWAKRQRKQVLQVRVLGVDTVFSQLYYFVPEKKLILPKSVNIQYTVKSTQTLPNQKYRYTLEFSSSVLAKNVHLHLKQAASDYTIRYSHNYFDMLPQQKYLVNIDTSLPISSLKEQLIWQHLSQQF